MKFDGDIYPGNIYPNNNCLFSKHDISLMYWIKLTNFRKYVANHYLLLSEFRKIEKQAIEFLYFEYTI